MDIFRVVALSTGEAVMLIARCVARAAQRVAVLIGLSLACGGPLSWRA